MDVALPQDATVNPLLQPWSTPYGMPPFADIEAAHFAPAMRVALAAHAAELAAIAGQMAAPTFDNTLVAFDRSGRLLRRIEALFENLTASESSAALQAAERELAAPMAAHGNAIYMNAALFARIDRLHANRARLGLDPEALRALERVHLDFVRAGARLDAVAQARYGQIVERLAELRTQFTQNVLAAEAGFRLVLRSEADIAGLPDSLLAVAANAARERGIEDGYLITLSRSLITPFLCHSQRRDLRKLAFKAWTDRGSGIGDADNRRVAAEIIRLRREQARFHGYQNYADYALADTMAGCPQSAEDLLMRVWEPAKLKAAEECAALQEMADADADGAPIAIEAWDWRFYAEQVRRRSFHLDDAEIKPYFALERMVEAMFDCAYRLFGIRFIHRPQVATYHSDVMVYEVRDEAAANRLIGVLLLDNFARPGKRGGAWMNAYRLQSRVDGDVLPIIVNNNNFARGAAGQATLLDFDEARTLFHEFGHGLHGLLSNVRFECLSGTQVLRDFVEFPSQLFEHWLSEPRVLKQHARHYRSGEPISEQLIERLKHARRFNQGFENIEYLSSAIVDLALHRLDNLDGLDLDAFEAGQLASIGMPAQIVMRHRLPHFQHLFSGSAYAAGYYVYLWASVLDADGFQAFLEAGNCFDPDLARRLRKFVYSSGNSRAPMDAFRAFRGRDPSVEPMLCKRGLRDQAGPADSPRNASN
jgi:peptidyl-dipeptidase Dcp